MVSVSLLQRLEDDHARIADTSGNEDETAAVDSILADLHIILNSRQGCCETRTDYGLMDFGAADDNYHNVISLIARAVEKQIRSFEPRLRGVVVRAIEDKTRPLELTLHISGEIAHRGRTTRIMFDSVLGGDGHIRLTR